MGSKQRLGIDCPKYAPYILLALFLLLASLIPGGPIETRDFSHLDPLTVWVFNGFLTFLGFGSLALDYFLFMRVRWAYKLGIVVGLLYSFLALLDLFQIFPKSPTPMSSLLIAFEGLILTLGLILAVASYRALSIAQPVGSPFTLSRRAKAVILLLMILLAVLAVAYASLSILR